MIYINGPFLSPVTHLVLAFYLLLKILLFIIEETIKLFFFLPLTSVQLHWAFIKEN